MNGMYLYRFLLLAGVGMLAAAPQNAAEVRRLTLTEAVNLAIRQNRSLKVARLRVTESEQKRAAAKANYFPELKNQSTFLHTTAFQNLEIPAGAFGVFPGVGVVPAHDTLIDQGKQTFVTSGTTLAQPLTQLIRIHQADRIAKSEIAASRDELKKTETEVALRVHELYYSILVARLQKRAAEQETAFAQTRLHESEEDVHNGNALRIATIEGRAGLLQSEQAALTIDLQLSDLTTELNDLLGLPLDTSLETERRAAGQLGRSPTRGVRKDCLGGESANPGGSCGRGASQGRGDRCQICLPSRCYGDRSLQLSKWCAICGAELWHVRLNHDIRRLRFRQAPRHGA